MIIFNNGKYKSILAAEKGELAEIAETVQKDKDFRPHFHIAPLTGLMNDPNGLIFDSKSSQGIRSSVLPMVSIRCNSRDETLEAFNHERLPTLSISR